MPRFSTVRRRWVLTEQEGVQLQIEIEQAAARARRWDLRCNSDIEWEAERLVCRRNQPLSYRAAAELAVTKEIEKENRYGHQTGAERGERT